ncbi:MAG: tRNA 2-thiouridine(34) synthase MnmA [Patescibacteria group bacterium]
MPKKIAIAVSGGADSAVAAYILKEEGYDLLGVFMHLGTKSCREDEEKARKICGSLNIDLQVIDISGAFQAEIIDYFIDGYKRGDTPNPCIRCNKRIKFGELLAYIESMGCELLATGHYAQIKKEKEEEKMIFKLYEAEDKNKDQSYFLYNLTQGKLAKIIFPLGKYKKEDVLSMAKEKKLETNKKESQDICFISGDHNKFLKEKTGLEEGEIRDVDDNILGKHQGLFFYTLGQRRGVNIGGTGPYYVVEKDKKKNILYVSRDKNDPRLYKNRLRSNELNWIAGKPKYKKLECSAKIRYNMAKRKCSLTEEKDGSWEVVFQEPVRGMSSGQSVVLYSGEEVLGGGEISEIY